MDQTTTTSEAKKICPVCGRTNQGHTIDFTTHCGLGTGWAYVICSPECDDRSSDFRMLLVELIEARERQMEANYASYVRSFYELKRRQKNLRTIGA